MGKMLRAWEVILIGGKILLTMVELMKILMKIRFCQLYIINLLNDMKDSFFMKEIN